MLRTLLICCLVESHQEASQRPLEAYQQIHLSLAERRLRPRLAFYEVNCSRSLLLILYDEASLFFSLLICYFF